MWGRKRVSLEVEEWSDYVWEGTRQTLTQTTGVLSLLPGNITFRGSPLVQTTGKSRFGAHRGL